MDVLIHGRWMSIAAEPLHFSSPGQAGHADMMMRLPDGRDKYSWAGGGGVVCRGSGERCRLFGTVDKADVTSSGGGWEKRERERERKDVVHHVPRLA